MEEEEKIDVEKLKRAGEILRTIKQQLVDIVKPEATLLQVAETIEDKIRQLGGEPAFPVNICIGHIAAHFTPLSEADGKLQDFNDIVKVDVGVHIDGYSVDSAVSFYFGDDEEKKQLIAMAEEAVKLAISKMKPGTPLSEIGAAVEDFVESKGFKTIRNLSGHKIERWILHGEKEVPTSKEATAPGVIEEGEVYAVEIFVTNGDGYVRARDEYRIYSFPKELPRRIPVHVSVARELLRYVHRRRKSLPFTPRWFKDVFTDADLKVAIAVLENVGLIFSYPVLVEKEGASVAQAEETVLITSSGAEIIT